MHRMFLGLFWIVGFSLSAPLAFGATWHVATTGSGSACTSVAPCAQINIGISKMGGGDTVIVHGGTYANDSNLNAPDGSAGAPSTVKSQPGDTVLIRPNNIGKDSIINIPANRHDVLWDGFILDAGDPGGTTHLTGYIVASGGDSNSTRPQNNTVQNSEWRMSRHSCFLGLGINWRILNNWLHDCGTDNNFDHGLYFSVDDSFIIGNTFGPNNSCYNIQNYVSGTAAANGVNPSNNTYRNNTFTGSRCGITFSYGTGHLFVNNISYNDNSSSTAASLCGVGDNTKIYNNTFYRSGLSGGTGIDAVCSSNTSAGAQFRNNIICGYATPIDQGSATLSNNTTSTSPCPAEFTSVGLPDGFHLASGSGAINTGMTLTEANPDKDSVVRPQGSAYDRGPYEFGGAPPPSATVLTIFVDTNNLGGTGNDATACASAGIATPRKTLAGGLACLDPTIAAAGSVLNIRAGTYNEKIDTQVTPIAKGTDATHRITIKAYNNEVVTLTRPDTSGGMINLRNTDAWVLIDGLTVDANNISNALVFFTGTHDSVFQNGELRKAGFEVVFNRSGNNNQVLNSKIHTSAAGSPLVGIFEASSGFTLTNNELYDSPDEAIEDETASTNTGTVITRNLIHDVAPAAGRSAVILQGATQSFFNNVIYGGANGLQVKAAATTLKAYNNTIYGRTGNAIQIDSGAQTTAVTNNLLYNNGAAVANNAGAQTTQTTNRTDNPNFIEPANNNFHIPSNSTAKGTGTTLAEVTVDKDGAARTAPYDVGAYVFTPGTSGPITVFVDTNNLGGTASDSTACASADITHPRKTIAGGLACLTAGGSTLYIRAGLYSENIDTGVTAIAAGSPSNQTVISAYGSEEVTLSLPAGKTVVVHLRNNDAYILLDRLILRGNTLGQGLVFASGTNNAIFQNGEIVNTLTEAVSNSGNTNQVLRSLIHTSSGSGGAPLVGIGGTANAFILDQNEIFDGPQTGVAEVTSTVANSAITRNKLHDLGVPNLKPAISVQGNSPDVINNIIYGGQAGIQVAAASRTASIFHNTIYNRPAAGIQVDSGAQTTALTNNIAYNNASNITNNAGVQTTQTTNITTNPSFVDPANGNFHIPTGSTAAGTGTTLAAVTVDADGMARTVPYDVGAYVYTPSLAPVKPGPPWQKQRFLRR